MIVKSYEISKAKLDQINLILLYGKNEGLKSEIIKKIYINNNEIINYEEKEILDKPNILYENILSLSLFGDEKNIIIKRATDKILNMLNEIENKNIGNTKLILVSDNLDKKSKLRSFFEKSKKNICVPFYVDDLKTLQTLAYNFFKERKIQISSENINLLINKCNGDRINLKNELTKIDLFCTNKKEINTQSLIKLINLVENHNILELIDNFYANNKKKTFRILNENNYTNDDCILIVRSFLNKAKKIFNLGIQYEKNKNIDQTISSTKPPIFWKDKEITKKQILIWKPFEIKKFIYELMELELKVKKNINFSINIITDFILNKSKINN